MNREQVIGALCLTILMLLLPGNVALSDTRASVSATMEREILTGNWQAVLNECGKTDEKTSAVVRAIAGQANLALNENDESLRLFVSIANDADRRAWLDWAVAFNDEVNKIGTSHPKPARAIAMYLEGDAQARLGDWEAARRCHNQATGLDPKCALAWNALGVTYLCLDKKPSQDNLDKAIQCLVAACDAKTDFADAHANRGIYFLLIGGTDEAIKCFQEAQTRSKRFALAHVGMACAQSRTIGDAEKQINAGKELAMATSCEAVHELVQQNLKLVAKTASDGSSDDSAAKSNAPGTALSREEKIMQRDLFNALSTIPPERKMEVIQAFTANMPREQAARVLGEGTGQKAAWSGGWSGLVNGLQASFEGTRSGRIEAGAGTVAGIPAAGIKGSLEATSKFAGSIDFKELGKLSGNHAEAWSLMATRAQELGFKPGGAELNGVGAKQAVGDFGSGTVKLTWFGIAPRQALPEVAQQ